MQTIGVLSMARASFHARLPEVFRNLVVRNEMKERSRREAGVLQTKEGEEESVH